MIDDKSTDEYWWGIIVVTEQYSYHIKSFTLNHSHIFLVQFTSRYNRIVISLGNYLLYPHINLLNHFMFSVCITICNRRHNACMDDGRSIAGIHVRYDSCTIATSRRRNKSHRTFLSTITSIRSNRINVHNTKGKLLSNNTRKDITITYETLFHDATFSYESISTFLFLITIVHILQYRYFYIPTLS